MLEGENTGNRWSISNVPRDEWIDEFMNLVKQIPKNANEYEVLMQIATIMAEMLGELKSLSFILKKLGENGKD